MSNQIKFNNLVLQCWFYWHLYLSQLRVAVFLLFPQSGNKVTVLAKWLSMFTEIFLLALINLLALARL